MQVTELELQALPLEDFLFALVALTPHDLTVMAKPAVEPEPVLEQDSNVIAETAVKLALITDHDRAVREWSYGSNRTRYKGM
jgi:hypothetical protein